MPAPTRRQASWLASIATLLVAAPAAADAAAKPPETYPLSQVRRGQTGYGYTTFAGATPEKFTFEVVSVVTNMLPNQDIILVKSDDEKLKVSGFWRGMSGSPLFIDGKLLCAFSYGWSFNKIPLGGCTPIEYMKKEGLDAVVRGGGPGTGAGVGKPSGGGRATTTLTRPVASAADWAAVAPGGDMVAGLAALAPPRESWLTQAPMMARLPAVSTPAGLDGAPSADLLSASVPLALGGFSAPAFGDLAALFAGYGVTPIRAAGAGGGTTGTAKSGAQILSPLAFELGGSISVQLIRGDMSAAGTGTVSYIDGDRVLAFGHPMFQAGEFYAPVATAEVHTVIASAQSAFVMASSRREIGALVEDRQSMIMADLTKRSPMIPVDIFVTSASAKGKQTGEFHVEVLDNKYWTAQLVGAAVGNAVDYYLPDRDDVTARVDSLIKLKGGLGDIRFTDYLYSSDGAASVVGGARGLRALIPLLMNPFTPVEFDRIELRIDLRFEANYGEIERVILPSTELPPGKRSMLKVVMTTHGDKEVTEEVAVDVPASAAGSILQLELTAGDFARLDRTSPTDLPELLGILREMKPGNAWVATLYEPTEGVAIDGVHVRDLPPSAADRLRPGTRTPRAVIYRPLAQTVTPASRVIIGGLPLMVKVASAPKKKP
jgi:hypothetical protein